MISGILNNKTSLTWSKATFYDRNRIIERAVYNELAGYLKFLTQTLRRLNLHLENELCCWAQGSPVVLTPEFKTVCMFIKLTVLYADVS